MLDKLKNYEPEFIEVVLDEATMEKYADMLVIFKGARNVEEVIKQLQDNFSAEFPEKEVVRRRLDGFEIANIREEYCAIQENELPDAIREQLDAYEKAKRIKKEADDNLLTVRKNIADLAARVKDGSEDYKLSSKNTVKLACSGNFFYFSWINDEMRLVKVEKVPSWDARPCGRSKSATVLRSRMCSALTCQARPSRKSLRMKRRKSRLEATATLMISGKPEKSNGK